MLLVSVEGLPGTCREAVAKALQHRLGAAAVPEYFPPAGSDAALTSLGFLLHQIQALKHAPPDAAVAVGHSSWLDKAPEGRWRGLHIGLAAAVRRRLGLSDGVHRMVYLRCDPHEAFEGVIDAGGEARDISLRGTIMPLQARLEACAAGTVPLDGMFRAVSLAAVPCPRFAADMAGAVNRLAAAAAEPFQA